MYSIQTVTEPASEPVTVSELKAYLRLNTDDEDSLLANFISTARQQFEHLTQRSVMPQTYRQWVDQFAPDNTIYLMRGDVQSISQVQYYDSSDVLTLDSTYSLSLGRVPARLIWTQPLTSSTKTPIAFVDFVAGFATVPEDIKLAIKLLAAHYFAQRSAYLVDNLKECPMGFCNVAAKYDLALRGSFGQ